MTTIKQFKIPIEYIKSVVNGNNNSFIFLGKQGLGKTTTTINTLKELKTKYPQYQNFSLENSRFHFRSFSPHLLFQQSEGQYSPYHRLEKPFLKKM